MPSSYLGLISKLSKKRTSEIRNLALKLVVMIKFQGLTDSALFVNLIKLKMNLIFLSVMH